MEVRQKVIFGYAIRAIPHVAGYWPWLSNHGLYQLSQDIEATTAKIQDRGEVEDGKEKA